MNNNIAVPNRGPWPSRRYRADGRSLAARASAPIRPANILDFPTLLRIIHHWRWLILGAVALGLAGGDPRDVADHAGLSRLGDARGQSADGRRSATSRSRERDVRRRTRYDFVATQVGLLTSKSVAERTAQELNLANNPDFVPQDGDASQPAAESRPAVVIGGLKVDRARRKAS